MNLFAACYWYRDVYFRDCRSISKTHLERFMVSSLDLIEYKGRYVESPVMLVSQTLRYISLNDSFISRQNPLMHINYIQNSLCMSSNSCRILLK